jgi:hypothetical protein
MALPAAAQRVLGWLHAGYPAGVPPTDYFAVLALISRQLSDQEVLDAADSLALALPLPAGTDSRTAIGDVIRRVTDTPPLNSDIDRVRKHLADAGWTDAA